MDKKTCPDGQKRDILLGICMPSNTVTKSQPAAKTEPPLIVQSPVRGTGLKIDQAEPVMLGLSPALCATVVLVTVGSVLALAVWLIIYRRQTRLHSTPADPESVQEPLQKTEPPATILPPPPESNGQAGTCQLAAEAPSSCPHLYLGTHMGPNWDKGFATCRGPAVQTNGCTGLPACSAVNEHRIPLPATELGGTALVTTKTV